MTCGMTLCGSPNKGRSGSEVRSERTNRSTKPGSEQASMRLRWILATYVGPRSADAHKRTSIRMWASAERGPTYVAKIQRSLIEACSDPGLVERFVRSLRTSLPLRPLFGLPHSVMPQVITHSEQLIIKFLPALPLDIEDLPGDAGIRLTACGRGFVFQSSVAPLLSGLADSPMMTIGEFYERFADTFEREDLADLLADLDKEGLVSF